MKFEYKNETELAAMSVEERAKYVTDKKAHEDAEIQAKIDAAVKEAEEKANAAIKVVQDHADKLDLRLQNKAKETPKVQSLQDLLAKTFEDNKDAIAAKQRGDNVRLTAKAPALMTNTSAVTGEGVITYRPGGSSILPGARLNMRDLIPVVNSDTGIYATYAETGGEGEVDFQSAEGAKKPFLDVDLTQLKTVTRVIAGTLDFSEQMLVHLPFLQGTLARILERKFFEKENDYIYTTMAAAATGGAAPVADSVAVSNLIGYVMSSLATNFYPSYIVVNPIDYGNILQGNALNNPIGLAYNPSTGRSDIAGIPVVFAPWAVAGKALIFDRDYTELVVSKDISIRFSDQNKDNFEKNVITAKIEAMEEVNIIYPQSITYQDLAGEVTPAG